MVQALYMSGSLPDDMTVAMRDPNILAGLLPTVERRMEEARLKA